MIRHLDMAVPVGSGINSCLRSYSTLLPRALGRLTELRRAKPHMGISPPRGSLLTALIAFGCDWTEVSAGRDHCETARHKLLYGRMGIALHLFWPSFTREALAGGRRASSNVAFASSAFLSVMLFRVGYVVVKER